ncbi:hypothetical protein [Rufibacter immobilis]|uniref:hypothetical protein n=1 Tax=Rufibacter immobilis TaxID=1348778 RepID=UPI0035E801C3
MAYDFTLHVHRFAVWTAARAVSRDFIGTQGVQEAIEETCLPLALEQIASRPDLDSTAFDAFHKGAVNKLIDSLKNKAGSAAHKVTYGRAAKIVAIYIKTRYVLPNPTSTLSKVAHPPIDAILLRNLSKTNKNSKLAKLRWTQLDEEKYFELLNLIRQEIELEYFWELEQFWVPS